MPISRLLKTFAQSRDCAQHVCTRKLEIAQKYTCNLEIATGTHGSLVPRPSHPSVCCSKFTPAILVLQATIAGVRRSEE